STFFPYTTLFRSNSSTVALDTRTSVSSIALRTARPGVDSGINRRLIRALVSTTTRARSGITLICVSEHGLQFLFCQATGSRPFTNTITKFLELLDIQGPQALVLSRRNQDSHIPLLAANRYRLVLRRIQHGG